MAPISRCFYPLWQNPARTPTLNPAPSKKRTIYSPLVGLSQPLGVSLILVATLSGCTSKSENAPPPPPGVTVTPVVKKDVEIHQEWVGTTSGNIDADIRPKVDGYLLKQI